MALDTEKLKEAVGRSAISMSDDDIPVVTIRLNELTWLIRHMDLSAYQSESQ